MLWIFFVQIFFEKNGFPIGKMVPDKFRSVPLSVHTTILNWFYGFSDTSMIKMLVQNQDTKLLLRNLFQACQKFPQYHFDPW